MDSGTPQLRVLGGVRAERDGSEVDLGGRLQRAVLAVLITARRTAIPGARLADLVWGDNLPANPSGALQSYVSHLRRRLEPDRGARDREGILRSSSAGYALHLPDDAVDAWRFEALVSAAARETDPVAIVSDLRQALELWGGRAYADYQGERWADAEAVRWDELHALAEDRLFAARLELEPATLLVPDLEVAVGAAPLREERWRLLALALYRANRQGDALGALRRARERLIDELGVDPGPQLRDLEAQVLAQDPALQPTSRLVLGGGRRANSSDSRPPDTQGRAVTDDLVDRDGEVGQIGTVLADARAGNGAVLLIEGPAGIGKTRLLAEARQRASAGGARVLTARGSQLEQQFAFGAVRQLFEPLVAQHPDLLAGAAEAARPVFHGSGAAGDRIDNQFASLHGLYWLAVNASTTAPLLLCVDDLQWCDTGSVRFFAYLARRLEGLPLALAATLRTGEEHADPTLIAEIQHEPATTVIRPWPLTLPGVEHLVRSRLGADADRRFVAACHRTTNGNPLLLRQVLRALEADKVRPDAAHADVVTAIGSRAIASLVLMRLNRLPGAAKAVARAIAVLGDGAGLDSAAGLAGMDDAAAADAVAALVRTEMIKDDYPLAFVHPLIREAVYGDVPTVLRQLQHDRAARALDAAGAPPEQVAAHLLHVPPRGDAWVAKVLRNAAHVAAERGIPESAAAYLNRVVAEPPPAELRAPILLELGEVESQLNGPSAVTHMRQAYELMSPGADRDRLAQRLAQVLVFAGEPGETARFADSAVRHVEPGSDAHQGLIGLKRVSGFMHNLDPTLWQAEEPPPISGGGPGARRLASALAWEHCIASREREQAVRLAYFSLEDDILRNVDTGLMWVVSAVVLEFADEDLTDFWTRMRVRAIADGSLFSMLSVHLWSGHTAWRGGDLREASAILRVANEQGAEWGNDVGHPYTDAFYLHVLIERGELAAARRFVDTSWDRYRVGDAERLCEQAEIELLIAEGRFEDALRHLDRIKHKLDYVRMLPYRRWTLQRAEALTGLGRTREALEWAEVALGHAREWGAPRVLGAALATYGRIPGEHSEAALREAVRILTPTRGYVDLSRARIGLARRLTDRDERVALLRAAVEAAEIAAADGLRRKAVDLLAADGVVLEPEAPPRLTPTERRIATMSLQGADEREIAQELFLTPRAVQLAVEEIRRRVGSVDLDGALAG